MRQRALGRTDLLVSELGFGAYGISGNRHEPSYGPTDDRRSIAAIEAALDRGCTLFDTADVYGLGHSERLLGTALRRSAAGCAALIATKGGCRLDRPGAQDFSETYLVAAAEASLRRLGRERIDLYLLHNPSAETLVRGDALGALDRLVAEGKIRFGGVSVHTAREGLAAVENPSCAVVQAAYSLLSQHDPSRSADGMLEGVAAAGAGLIGREPLANGFLARRHRVDEHYPEGDTRGAFSEGEHRLRIALADTLRPRWPGAPSLLELALRYAVAEPRIASSLVGLKTPEQVAECFGALERGGAVEEFEALLAQIGAGA
jgi:aryl-alcohol dehydrogenase-like predicted oxidoreductase